MEKICSFCPFKFFNLRVRISSHIPNGYNMYCVIWSLSSASSLHLTKAMANHVSV